MYLGNKIAYYGGRLTYELKSEGTGPLLDEPEVILVGSGLTLVYDKPLTVAAGWNSRAVPLTASGWTFREPKGRAATPEEFERALSSVAALRINGEFRTGTDTGWLAAVSMEPASPPTPERVSGPSTPLVDQVVPRTGGHLEYRNPGHPLDGFTINIPDGAYDGARRFHVSTRPAPFDAATPLISVENGGEYATTPMAVRIPVRVQSDEFAMAFFYDEKTGTREGLALLTQDSDSVTAMTLHFSDIFVAKIKKLLLPAKVSSGFLPGRDDWQMINYGSVVAPGGHCAGQSLSSMWYYCEKKLKGAPSLYGQYDHNAPGFKEHPSSKTPGFWEDDSLGVRLASTIQEDGWWNAGAAA
ncbi:MAG: hypothetical protein NTY02_13175 [Acidobacteria bacterium]|nr:hypothetical protein [Acidobacteriota bacterium]